MSKSIHTPLCSSRCLCGKIEVNSVELKKSMKLPAHVRVFVFEFKMTDAYHKWINLEYGDSGFALLKKNIYTHADVYQLVKTAEFDNQDFEDWIGPIECILMHTPITVFIEVLRARSSEIKQFNQFTDMVIVNNIQDICVSDLVQIHELVPFKFEQAHMYTLIHSMSIPQLEWVVNTFQLLVTTEHLMQIMGNHNYELALWLVDTHDHFQITNNIVDLVFETKLSGQIGKTMVNLVDRIVRKHMFHPTPQVINKLDPTQKACFSVLFNYTFPKNIVIRLD